MSGEWRDLGVRLPDSIWQPFLQTEGKSTLFRVSFDLPTRYWDSYSNSILLCFRYSPNLPPSQTFRIFPDSRGILLEVPWARYASLLGHDRRIFEIKKFRRDSINLRVQLEEMLLNVPPPDENNTTPEPPRVQFQAGNLVYTWNANSGYEHKTDEIQFPLFTALSKISSNFPVRIRIYQSTEKALEDLGRPPHINPEFSMQRGLFLDAVLSGNQTENQLYLSPIALIINSQKSPVILEKLFPNAATINLRFDFVG